MSSTHSIRHLIAVAVCLSLTACGGGGGGSSGGPGDPGSPGGPGGPGNPGGPSGPDGPAATFAVGGTISGLDGAVVLQNNLGDDLPVSTNGAFRFVTAIVGGGTPYRVTVKMQPELQTCVVTNESGNVNAAAITNVQVTCALATFDVGGNVVGLSGSGLVLQNNGRDDVTIDASGAQTFRFATPVAAGERYNVTVLKQPVDPVQKCIVSSGEGTAKNTNVPQPIVTCASSFSRFAYVANFDTDTLSINSIDSVTGQLRHRSYVSTGDNPTAVAVDETNKWVAVTNASALASSVSLFEITRSDGSLTLRSETPAGLFPSSVAIDTARQFAYVTNFAAHSVSLYRIESDGRMTEPNANMRAQTEDSPNEVAIDRRRPVIYVANFGSNSIWAYAVNETTSALARFAMRSTGTRPIHITFDTADRFMYVVNQGSGDVSIFEKPDLTTSDWPELLDSPVGVGADPSNLAFDPSGRFAFVVGDNTLKEFVFASDGTGVPTLSPFSVTVSAGQHAVSTDALGKFVFVTNRDSGEVETFSLNSQTGALTRVSRAASRGKPAAIAVSNGLSPVKDVSKFAYVLNSNATVSTFPFDPVAGLQRKIEPDAPTAPGPRAIALDPRGRSAYVTNVADTVSRFTIDGATGVLAQQPIVPARQGPTAIAVDILGRFAYVTNVIRNVSRFAIAAESGDLRDPIEFPAGFGPSSIALDPTGRFAYVANSVETSIFPYEINAADGALIKKTQLTTAAHPTAVVADPSGRFVFEVGADPTDNVNSYVIDPLTGELTDVGAPVRAGAQAVALAVAPSGRFLYTVNNVAGHASIFKVTINTETGEVQPDPREFPLSPDRVPSRIAIDASGSFLYVAERDAGVEVFRIDPETGDLDEERVGQFSTGSTATSIVISSAIQ